jgi:hypothetical protein
MQNNNLNQLVPFSIIKRFPQVLMKKEQVYVDDCKQTVIDWAHDWYCNVTVENKKHLYLYYGFEHDDSLILHELYFLLKKIFGGS